MHSGCARRAAAGLFILAGLATACGRGDEAPAAEEPSTPEVAQASAPQQLQARAPSRPVVPPREPTFPHSPHQTVACVTCHRSVAGHVTHRQFECTQCHVVPERFASLGGLPSRACLECHHGGEQRATCTNCHRPQELADPVRVVALMRLSGREQARERELAFDHQRHRGLPCTNCHATSVEREFKTECRSCHQEHHRADASCRACHAAVEPSVHAEAAHAGCGGAGCHRDATVAALPPVRTVCLACHHDKMNHEVGRECAQCHQVSESWRRRRG